MIKGSTVGLESPFMAWVIAYAQAIGFDSKAAPHQMISLIKRVFRGQGHSRLNEEANKLLRDAEGRDNPNNTVAFVRMWSTLANSALMRTEGRAEVSADSQCSVPGGRLPDKLFRSTPLLPANPQEP
eukprot:3661222-Pyramimonas_sp.AAC.1